MKKRTKILLGIFIPLTLFTGGIIAMTQKTPFDIFLTHDFTGKAKENTRETQIAFLKKHEKEMTDFIKAQNPKVTSVQFDWDSIQTGDTGNGTPQGAGDYLLLFGGFNNITNSGFRLDFYIDNTGSIDMKSMNLGQTLGVGGSDFE